MKIVEPKAWIIEDELEKLSVYQRIDRCASVCYQRPPKATEEEAKEFCMSMIKRKHWVPLEMAVVHLWVEHEVMVPESKYIVNSRLGFGGGYVVSGSIRAFMESPDEYGSHVWRLLASEYPDFFTESDPPNPYNVRFARDEETPWQHKHIAVQVICSRSISHQLVRHRPCSILQESQRYCRYDVDRFDGEITVIQPEWFNGKAYMEGNLPEHIWHDKCANAEQGYICLLNNGKTPQQARDVLPNSCKTELMIYASLPEWKHILNTDTMRCSPHADPEMRRIMEPLRGEFMERLPEVGW